MPRILNVNDPADVAALCRTLDHFLALMSNQEQHALAAKHALGSRGTLMSWSGGRKVPGPFRCAKLSEMVFELQQRQWPVNSSLAPVDLEPISLSGDLQRKKRHVRLVPVSVPTVRRREPVHPTLLSSASPSLPSPVSSSPVSPAGSPIPLFPLPPWGEAREKELKFNERIGTIADFLSKRLCFRVTGEQALDYALNKAIAEFSQN